MEKYYNQKQKIRRLIISIHNNESFLYSMRFQKELVLF